jgi:hypothetical protein
MFNLKLKVMGDQLIAKAKSMITTPTWHPEWDPGPDWWGKFEFTPEQYINIRELQVDSAMKKLEIDKKFFTEARRMVKPIVKAR